MARLKTGRKKRTTRKAVSRRAGTTQSVVVRLVGSTRPAQSDGAAIKQPVFVGGGGAASSSSSAPGGGGGFLGGGGRGGDPTLGPELLRELAATQRLIERQGADRDRGVMQELGRLSDRTRDLVRNLRGQLGDQLETAAQTMLDRIRDAQQDIDTNRLNLDNVRQELRGVNTALTALEQQAADARRDAMRNAQQTIGRLDDHLRTTGEATADLREAIQNLRQQVRDDSQAIVEQSQALVPRQATETQRTLRELYDALVSTGDARAMALFEALQEYIERATNATMEMTARVGRFVATQGSQERQDIMTGVQGLDQQMRAQGDETRAAMMDVQQDLAGIQAQQEEAARRFRSFAQQAAGAANTVLDAMQQRGGAAHPFRGAHTGHPIVPTMPTGEGGLGAIVPVDPASVVPPQNAGGALVPFGGDAQATPFQYGPMVQWRPPQDTDDV